MKLVEQTSTMLSDLYHPEVHDLVSSLCPTEVYPPGHAFCTPNERIDGILYINTGRTRHFILNEDGAAKLVYSLKRGWFFGEASFLLGIPSSLYSETEVATSICRITRDTYEYLMKQSSQFREVLIQCLCYKVLVSRYEIESITFSSVKDRLRRFICCVVDDQRVIDDDWFPLRVNYKHDYLATIVGSTRVTVCRLLSELRDEGFLRVVNRRTQVHCRAYHDHLEKT